MLNSIKEKNREEFEKLFPPLVKIIDEAGNLVDEEREWVGNFLSAAEDRIIEGMVEELNKLPVGHTPDGKNHWVDYKAIKDLKKKLEEEMK